MLRPSAQSRRRGRQAGGCKAGARISRRDVETCNLDIAADDGKSIDRFGQVRLPWILAATAKAYPSGSLMQKARTLAWLERVLNDPAARRADTRDLDWVRAEVLLGLAYASRDLGEGGAGPGGS